MISAETTFATTPGPMPGALRDLATSMGILPLVGLTEGAARCLASACHAFAALIEADPSTDARFGPCFLVSALSSLRGGGEGASMSGQDEAWLVSEIEGELVEAKARVAARAARASSPSTARALAHARPSRRGEAA